MTGEWRLERSRSTASAFHARQIPDPPRPEIWVHEITAPAVVLGSTQRGDDIVDVDACDRAGIEVVRRRSGGGAVWLAPQQVGWIDVIIPADGPGWAVDVHAPMVWLGEHLAAALSSLGVGDARVHTGAMINTDHSRLVCFDGVGPGELLRGDAKLVGISQRRTRTAARLQCCWYLQHDHRDLVTLLHDEPTGLRSVATVAADVSQRLPTVLLAALNA